MALRLFLVCFTPLRQWSVRHARGLTPSTGFRIVPWHCIPCGRGSAYHARAGRVARRERAVKGLLFRLPHVLQRNPELHLAFRAR